MTVGIILTPSFRAMAYLQRLAKENILPSSAIIMKGSPDYVEKINNNNDPAFFDEFESFEETLTRLNIPYVTVDAKDCNEKAVIDAVKNRKEEYFIYTGGGILQKEILSVGKKFIHVHPGIVPNYRGSTCMYYSILQDDNCGATSFFMALELDEGDVLAKRVFKKPFKTNIDYVYDCHMRSTVLVDVMKGYQKERKFITRKQDIDAGETYYIIHPVLKHIALLSCGVEP